MSAKITNDHLARRACVYIRQSTPGQVTGNLESRRLQYGLAKRAETLGFAAVEVIDEDLGKSGAGFAQRPGFERLLAMVCGGGVGAILCIEASRLARNGRDWHHLIGFCALVSTLLIDPEGVYDPRLANDRLLLGLKGTMSEFELTLFRQRSLEAKKAKAQRGELRFRLPVGLHWADDDRIELDPNRRVQEAIRSVFGRFERLGSMRQVLLTMRAEGLRLPAVVKNDATRIEWKLPVYNTILKLLTNPLYAGAYAYGKTEARTKIVEQRAHKTMGHRKPMEKWSVLIPDHHPGYISWEQFERNQQVVAANAHMKKRTAPKSARGGQALLSGLLRCHRCGRMLHVAYGGKRQPGARYECRGANINHGQGAVRCFGFGALRVDEAIARMLLDAVSLKAVDEAIELAAKAASEESDAHRAASLELEQAEYDAALARRRYEAVDPENRLVVSELEARWNAAMEHVRERKEKLEEVARTGTLKVNVSREALLPMADSLQEAWNSPVADMRVKQRITRVLVREIIADVDFDRSEIVLVIHWCGGRHTEIRVPKKRMGQHNRKASVEVEEVIRRMWGRWSSEEIAATLNRIGLRTGTGLTWNESRVEGVRKRLSLTSSDAARTRRTLTLNDAIERLGVSNTVIRGLIRKGVIKAIQVVPHAPHEIEPESLDSPEVIAAVRRTRERGKPARDWAADRRTLTLPFDRDSDA